MTLTQKQGYWYGENHADIEAELARYSKKNGYEINHFKNAICKCGNDGFNIVMNDDEGVAARICTKCNSEHGIGDSDDFIDEVDSVWESECICGEKIFKVTAGVSLYQNSEDVRWFYLGLLCTKCMCVGCYGDWKNEYIGYKELLKRI